MSWILLHPFSASGRFWDARAAALAARHEVRIISPDLPSHGRSRIVGRFDYSAAAEAMVEAMAVERDRCAVIIGASSGAIVGMKLAARWLKPVVAIGAGSAFSAENLRGMRDLSRELSPAAARFVDAFLEQGAAQRSAIRRHYGDLAALGQTPLLSKAEASALAGRALIINGASDSFFARDQAHALAEAIPGSVLSFVTGADHLEPLAGAHRDFTWGQVGAFVEAQGARPPDRP